MSKLLVAIAASALVSAPVLAAPATAPANPAASLSLAKAAGVKRSSTVKKGNKLEGALLAATVVAGAAATVGFVALVDNSDSN